jgi:carboxyl-terminal processing protease
MQYNTTKMPKKNYAQRFLFFIVGILLFLVGVQVGRLEFSNQNNYFSKEQVLSFADGTLDGIGDSAPDFLEIKDQNVDFDIFWDVWARLKEGFYKQPVNDKDIFYGAIKGMVASLGDQHTYYFNPEEAEAFKNDLKGVFEGIGAEIAIKQQRLTVVSPLSGSPAKRAGLRPGDKIFAIDGFDTTNINIHDAVTKIRGNKGTEVVLQVIHKGETEPIDITITRDKITVISVEWDFRAINDGGKKDIAYISIRNFSEDSSKTFGKVAQEVVVSKPKAIILDLRNNPGGFLQSAIDIASYWVAPERVVVSQKSPTHGNLEYTANKKNSFFNGIKTIVLVNEGSASASEIVSGALQDYKLATVVGEKTFGKGSVQDFFDGFEDKSALKITIAEWLTPKGRVINEVGLDPDVFVELTIEDFSDDKDPQLDKAFELLK